MRVYAIVNQKGGVGKTTTTLNTGAGLAALGKRVLLIDADQSGNLTRSAGVELGDDAATLYEVLKGKTDINDAIRPAGSGKYDVLPADNMLSGIDLELATVPGREVLLREALEQIEQEYSHILIDCPPALNVISVMALTASQGVIVPVQPHILALDGLAQLMQTISLVKKRMNPQVEMAGILATMYDPRKILSREVMETLESAFPGMVYETKISNNIALAEAPGHGEDIFTYSHRSRGAAQYAELALEIIKKEESQHGKQEN